MKELDRIYIAKYYEKLGLEEIAKSYTGHTKLDIKKEIENMKVNGTYFLYKEMPEEEWFNLENKTDKYIKEKYYKLAKRRGQELLLEAFKINFRDVIKQFPVYMYNKQIFYDDYFQESDYEGEEWKQIPNLNYLISNYGRIKNITTKKLKKLKFNKYGMQVILWQNSKSYNITVSRLVAELFIRHIENNEKVFHKNKHIRDNYYKNLEIKEV